MFLMKNVSFCQSPDFCVEVTYGHTVTFTGLHQCVAGGPGRQPLPGSTTSLN